MPHGDRPHVTHDDSAEEHMTGMRLVDLVEACRALVGCWDSFQDHPNHDNARALTDEAKELQDCLVQFGWVPPAATRAERSHDNVIPLIGHKPSDGRAVGYRSKDRRFDGWS
jgi:hypothetical protein